MTIQTFDLYSKKGYAGELCDSGPRVAQTGILDDAEAGFGLALKRGADDRHVALGHDAGEVFGISMREYNHYSRSVPSDGTDFKYYKDDLVSVIRQGFLFVKVTGRAMTAGSKINVDDTTGAFTGGAAGAGETRTTNVTCEESGGVGDIVKVRIDIA